MSSRRVTEAGGLGRPAAMVLAAMLAIGGLLFGSVFAARPALSLLVLAAAAFAAVVMTSVAAGIALLVPVAFVNPGIAISGMLVLTAAAWIGSLVAHPGSLRRALPAQHVLVGAVALLLAWMCLSLLWSRNPELSWGELRSWLIAGGVVLVAASSIHSATEVRWIMLAFVAGALLSVAIGLLQSHGPAVATLGNPADPNRRFAGAEGDPNDLAAQLLPCIVAAVALAALQARLILRVALAAAALGLTVAFAATESRGGLVAAIAVVLVAVVLARRGRRRMLAAIAILMAALVAWLALSPAALHRVTDFGDQGSGRSTLWLVAWRVATDHAPEGVGLNNFRAVAPEYVRRPGALRYVGQIDSPHVVHNVYLQLLAEVGPVGLALFLIVTGACLAAGRRAVRIYERLGDGLGMRLAWAALLAGVAVLASAAFQPDGVDVRDWIWLALGPALLALAHQRLSGSPAPGAAEVAT